MADKELRDCWRAVVEDSGDVRAVQRLVGVLGRSGVGAVLSFVRSFCVPGCFFLVDRPEGYWFVNLPYRGGVVNVCWSKEFAGKKQSRILLRRDFRAKPVQRTQDQWITFFRRLGGGWELPDVSLYYATFRALFAAQGDWQKELVETLRNGFQNDFGNFWMATGTRVVYGGVGRQDVVLHRIGTTEQYVGGEGNFIGPSDWIRERNNQEELIHALFGTRNIPEVKQVCDWVSKRNLYLWRLGQRPASSTERAVVLGGIDDGRFLIDCYDVVGFIRPARGVVVTSARKKNP